MLSWKVLYYVHIIRCIVRQANHARSVAAVHLAHCSFDAMQAISQAHLVGAGGTCQQQQLLPADSAQPQLRGLVSSQLPR